MKKAGLLLSLAFLVFFFSRVQAKNPPAKRKCCHHPLPTEEFILFLPPMTVGSTCKWISKEPSSQMMAFYHWYLLHENTWDTSTFQIPPFNLRHQVFEEYFSFILQHYPQLRVAPFPLHSENGFVHSADTSSSAKVSLPTPSSSSNEASGYSRQVLSVTRK
ncbi:MAG: hypothetical protein ACYCOO_02900 [Chitinophagaceae bacterium]